MNSSSWCDDGWCVMPNGSPPVLSVVLSFRNEAQVIPELLLRLNRVLSALSLEYEVIFVNDASVDDSLRLLTEEAGRNRRLKIITMSRAFGQAECAVAGLAFSTGAAVLLMDTDLQDPPELIPSLVTEWRAGADVVYTVRTRRLGESLLKSLVTRAGYHVIRTVANIDLPVEAGDFRLLSRRVVDELLKLPEHSPYLRGLVAWVGFKQVPVYYERRPRFAGRTHFPLFSPNPWRGFFSGLTSFSSAPLVVFLPIGLAICLGSFGAAGVIWMTPQWRAGVPASGLVALSLTALCGLQLAGLGLIGVYIGRILQDVRGRPRYIIESVVGVDDGSVSSASVSR